MSISTTTSRPSCRMWRARQAREFAKWDGNFYACDEAEYEHMLDACLYFIPPHRFTVVDAQFIHELSSKVCHLHLGCARTCCIAAVLVGSHAKPY